MIDARPATLRMVLHQRMDFGDGPDDDPEYHAEAVWPVGFPLPRCDDEIEVGDVMGSIARVVWRTDPEPHLYIEVR